jgi:hypothetical protein
MMSNITAKDIKRYIKEMDEDARYLGLSTNPINYNPFHTEILIKGDADPVIIARVSPRLGAKGGYFWSRKIEVTQYYLKESFKGDYQATDLLEYFKEGRTEYKSSIIMALKAKATLKLQENV